MEKNNTVLPNLARLRWDFALQFFSGIGLLAAALMV